MKFIEPDTKEILVRIKTHKDLIDEICSKVKKMHNYDVPELISYDLNIESNEYKKWFNSLDK